MEYTASNGMGVMALDRSNCKMVGVVTTRDLAVTNKEFTDKYKDENLALTPFVNLICRFALPK